ncbi:hypothetical protein [Streptomyces poonensis]|uniref:Uncharacterized protein n=1 Tax=Streptomyces poonensis TaxID=68255 RepID=A0A918UFU4_9ACTN|nr:hypothetical protein [Streptomyces poonensis]GGZ03198.1 hypothetical protein GCM10010365_22450 [Streptomyces poonensis]GLJ92965.1 hypothetical protein GCM10017589_55760 [Streptomyces poonensis]
MSDISLGFMRREAGVTRQEIPRRLCILIAIGGAVLVSCADGHRPDANRSSSPSPPPSRSPIPRTSSSTSSDGPSTRPPRGVAYAKAKAVLDSNREEIWERYASIQGSGIGAVEGAWDEKSADSDPEIFVIVIHLTDSADVPGFPQTVEGVPLRFEVGGPFTAQPLT